jgi:hypothetical protein
MRVAGPAGSPNPWSGWARDRLTLSLDEISQKIKEEKATSFPNQGPKIDSSPLIEGRGGRSWKWGGTRHPERENLLPLIAGCSQDIRGPLPLRYLPDVLTMCYRLSLLVWWVWSGILGSNYLLSPPRLRPTSRFSRGCGKCYHFFWIRYSSENEYSSVSRGMAWAHIPAPIHLRIRRCSHAGCRARLVGRERQEGR